MGVSIVCNERSSFPLFSLFSLCQLHLPTPPTSEIAPSMQCAATSGSSSSGVTLAAIFAEARVDPAPTTDAEALAAHLFNHAEVLRQRSAALTARLEAEEAAEAAVRAESAALQAEIRQYRGWITEEIEGGANYRLSKALHEERDRRTMLEEEVRRLKVHLTGLGGQLKDFVRQATLETPQAVQYRAADEVCACSEPIIPCHKPRLLAHVFSFSPRALRSLFCCLVPNSVRNTYRTRAGLQALSQLSKLRALSSSSQQSSEKG